MTESNLYLAQPPPLTTAIRAGWICFGIGAATFWIFGIGMVFFSAALIFGIVAMATHEVRRGLALFSSSLAVVVLIPLSIMLFGLSILGYVGARAYRTVPNSVSPLMIQRAQIRQRSTQSVHVNLVASVETFLRNARVSAVVSGNPAIAVINGKDYEVDQELITPDGARLRITAINGNSVYLRWQNRDFVIATRY